MIVACGMLSYSELGQAVIHVNPEHPKYAQWVTGLVSVQAMEELGNFQLPGIILHYYYLYICNSADTLIQINLH